MLAIDFLWFVLPAAVLALGAYDTLHGRDEEWRR